jgi:hypothetical protein
MDIEDQIKKTRQIVEIDNDLSVSDELILENQLVILETLKKLTEVKDRGYFGPG